MTKDCRGESACQLGRLGAAEVAPGPGGSWTRLDPHSKDSLSLLADCHACFRADLQNPLLHDRLGLRASYISVTCHGRAKRRAQRYVMLLHSRERAALNWNRTAAHELAVESTRSTCSGISRPPAVATERGSARVRAQGLRAMAALAAREVHTTNAHA